MSLLTFFCAVAGDYCVDIAQTQQPFIAAEYAPNAGYEDVDTAVEPGRYISFGRNSKAEHSWKNAVIYKKNLWNSKLKIRRAY